MSTELQKAIAYTNRKVSTVNAELATKMSAEDIPDNYIQGTGITSIVKLTQAEYDALTPVETTLYIIVG